MSSDQRPGGLTALAVLNFIFAGINAIALLFFVAALGLSQAMSTAATQDHNSTAQQKQQFQDATHVASGVMGALALVSLVAIVLLIVSGVGFLKQRRVLGRMVGNAYALLSLLYQGAFFVLTHSNFSLMSIIGLIYPVVLLLLLNTTFRDDLVN